MKYNTFFITITLCTALLAFPNLSAEATEQGFLNRAYYGITNMFRNTYISQSISNIVSRWNRKTQISVATIAILSLIAFYGKNRIQQWFNQLINQEPTDEQRTILLQSLGVDPLTNETYTAMVQEINDYSNKEFSVMTATYPTPNAIIATLLKQATDTVLTKNKQEQLANTIAFIHKPVEINKIIQNTHNKTITNAQAEQTLDTIKNYYKENSPLNINGIAINVYLYTIEQTISNPVQNTQAVKLLKDYLTDTVYPKLSTIHPELKYLYQNQIQQ